MENDIGRRVLDLVAMMGEELLRNGAEIARVQDTMLIVGKAFGKADVDVMLYPMGFL